MAFFPVLLGLEVLRWGGPLDSETFLAAGPLGLEVLRWGGPLDSETVFR